MHMKKATKSLMNLFSQILPVAHTKFQDNEVKVILQKYTVPFKNLGSLTVNVYNK